MTRQTKAPRTFTMREIAARLDITLMAISNWRKGSPKRVPLKCLVEAHGAASRVLVREDDLLEFFTAYRPDLKAKWLGTNKG